MQVNLRHGVVKRAKSLKSNAEGDIIERFLLHNSQQH